MKCDGKKFGLNTIRNKLSQYSFFVISDDIIWRIRPMQFRKWTYSVWFVAFSLKPEVLRKQWKWSSSRDLFCSMKFGETYVDWLNI